MICPTRRKLPPSEDLLIWDLPSYCTFVFFFFVDLFFVFFSFKDPYFVCGHSSLFHIQFILYFIVILCYHFGGLVLYFFYIGLVIIFFRVFMAANSQYAFVTFILLLSRRYTIDTSRCNYRINVLLRFGWWFIR